VDHRINLSSFALLNDNQQELMLIASSRIDDGGHDQRRDAPKARAISPTDRAIMRGLNSGKFEPPILGNAAMREWDGTHQLIRTEPEVQKSTKLSEQESNNHME